MQLLVCCSLAVGFVVRASDWHSGLGFESKNFFVDSISLSALLTVR